MAEEDPSYEEFVQRQYPLRPSDHPDWQRLTDVVSVVEEWKASGASAEQAYGKLIDTYSLAYLAANRAGMAPPPSYDPQAVHLNQTNAWVEGFLFGVLFQKLGGGITQDQEPSTE